MIYVLVSFATCQESETVETVANPDPNFEPMYLEGVYKPYYDDETVHNYTVSSMTCLTSPLKNFTCLYYVFVDIEDGSARSLGMDEPPVDYVLETMPVSSYTESSRFKASYTRSNLGTCISIQAMGLKSKYKRRKALLRDYIDICMPIVAARVFTKRLITRCLMLLSSYLQPIRRNAMIAHPGRYYELITGVVDALHEMFEKIYMVYGLSADSMTDSSVMDLTHFDLKTLERVLNRGLTKESGYVFDKLCAASIVIYMAMQEMDLDKKGRMTTVNDLIRIMHHYIAKSIQQPFVSALSSDIARLMRKTHPDKEVEEESEESGESYKVSKVASGDSARGVIKGVSLYILALGILLCILPLYKYFFS